MNWRPLLFIPPIVVGIGIFYVMTRPDDGQVTAPAAETPLAVRAVVFEPQSFTASVSGFGRVEAEQSWQAIPQVSGRVIDVFDGLAVGSIVKDGATLIRIDPRDYEIARSKAEASLASAQANLEEIDAELANNQASLELEQKIESFLQTEFDRQQALVDRGTVSQSVLDLATRELIAQQQKVLGLQNTIALSPVQRLSLEAAVATAEAELEEAERNIANTTITAPFTGRVAEESVADGQFVSLGDRLVTLEATSAAEVVAAFQPRTLGALIGTIVNGDAANLLDFESDQIALDFLKRLNLQATVRLSAGNLSFSWPAEIVRFSGTVDDVTGAFGIVVRVDDPSRPNPAQRRPPLNTGTFVEVILSAPEAVSQLLVDRAALHTAGDGSRFVYLVDDDSRLKRATIETGPTIADNVLVTVGIEAGEILVLSDPQPAVIGMLLEPVMETATPVETAGEDTLLDQPLQADGAEIEEQ